MLHRKLNSKKCISVHDVTPFTCQQMLYSREKEYFGRFILSRCVIVDAVLGLWPIQPLCLLSKW